MVYRVEQYQRGDEGDIVELLQMVFNGWPQFDLSCTPLEHWKWKYLDNPRSKQIIAKAVSESDDKIIGCQHGMDLNVKIGDDLHYFNNVADLAVHPEYRRMGIWSNMNKFRAKKRVEAGARINFWATNNPAIINTILTPGRFEFPKVITHFVKVKNLDLHFKMAPSDNTWVKKLGYRVLFLLYKVRSLFKQRTTSDTKVKTRKISKFDNRINEFWDEISKDYSFIVERRQDYLNWRYCDPRGGDYHVSIAEEDDSIVGFIIARINKYDRDYHRGQIVDLLTISDRKDTAEVLIQEAIEFFNQNNVNLIDCLSVRDSHLAKSLLEYGFLDSRVKCYVAISPREMDENEIKDVSHNILKKKVHFVYGDFDSI